MVSATAREERVKHAFKQTLQQRFCNADHALEHQLAKHGVTEGDEGALSGVPHGRSCDESLTLEWSPEHEVGDVEQQDAADEVRAFTMAALAADLGVIPT